MNADMILDTVETFIDTHPEIADDDRPLKFSVHTTGEESSVRMMRITYGEEEYLIVAKHIGN